MTETLLPRPEMVLFDIGNVLITWRPEDRLDEIVGVARRKQLFETVDMHAMNERFDRGEDFRDVVTQTAAAHPHLSDTIMLWHDRWLDLATPPIARSVRLLRALRRRGILVAALSNFGIDSFARSEKRDRFLTEFDRRYISGHMGVTKPDPRIYEMVEDDCKIAPERLLFTDDREENIAAARVRGWQTHLFTGPEGWADRLVSAGLLSREDAV